MTANPQSAGEIKETLSECPSRRCAHSGHGCQRSPCGRGQKDRRNQDRPSLRHHGMRCGGGDEGRAGDPAKGNILPDRPPDYGGLRLSETLNHVA